MESMCDRARAVLSERDRQVLDGWAEAARCAWRRVSWGLVLGDGGQFGVAFLEESEQHGRDTILATARPLGDGSWGGAHGDDLAVRHRATSLAELLERAGWLHGPQAPEGEARLAA